MRWEGNLNNHLLFPIVVTTKGLVLVVLDNEKKEVISLELKVAWEDNVVDAADRKQERYKDLITVYKEAKRKGGKQNATTLDLAAVGTLAVR